MLNDRSGRPTMLMLTVLIANEDNAEFNYIIMTDVVEHVLDDDDVMACVASRSHGRDAGGSPPRSPTWPYTACSSCVLRPKCVLKKAFRNNNQQQLRLAFDVGSYWCRIDEECANRAKNTIPTIKEILFSARRTNISRERASRGPHSDVKKTHSNSKTGQFNTKENKRDTLEQRHHRTRRSRILDEEVLSVNRQTCRAWEEVTQVWIKLLAGAQFRHFAQAEEVQQRAYLTALKGDADQRASAAYQNTKTMYGVVAIEQLAQDNARGEDNNESASGEVREGEEGKEGGAKHSSDGTLFF
ncbi:hypothetical protein Tco_0140063 [Tanacetum coccineum]